MGSVFESKTRNYCKLLLLGHFWLNNVNLTTVTIMSGLCNDTVVLLYKQFQERVEDNLQIIDEMIGGENIFVKIDDCNLGKRKYYGGHAVQGAWVLS